MTEEKSVVVTGTSTGIGWSAAKVLLANGFHVYGSVRKQSDAERLQAEFGAKFTPLLMDVTDPEAIHRAAVLVGQRLGRRRLTGLVNNAGIAVPGPLLHLAAEEYRWQLEVNLIAPLLVIQAFAPLLGTDRSRTGNPGRILNVSSVAGKMGAPFLGAYVASKHGLEGMSESLRRELLLYGIDVIVIGPGSVVTPIWDKAEADDFARYRGTDYEGIIARFSQYFITEGRKGLLPEKIGKGIAHALSVTRPKLRYALVPRKFLNWTLPMSLPKRLVDRMIGKQSGLIPAAARK